MGGLFFCGADCGLPYQLQISRARLAPIGDHFVTELMALVETAGAGTLNRADMNEHVFAAVIRLDEAETLLRIEPLYCSIFSFPIPVALQLSFQEVSLSAG